MVKFRAIGPFGLRGVVVVEGSCGIAAVWGDLGAARELGAG